MYGVYIKTDGATRHANGSNQTNIKAQSVIDINSNKFLYNINGYTKIDEGEGERYHHAHTHYLKKPVFDERFRPNYKFENGKVLERSEAEKEIYYEFTI